MKETGIIMSGDHPRKILDGTKTMTRRVIKPQPEPCDHLKVFGDKDPQSKKLTEFYEVYPGEWACRVCGKGIEKDLASNNPFDAKGIKCPYGQVGDRLWVRETLKEDDYGRWFYKADGEPVMVAIQDETAMRAWTQHKEQNYASSLFMPRWASRITLEITEEKAARTQDLTLIEAMAEGYNSIEEANKAFLKLAHLPEDSNVWNWVTFYKLILGCG